MYRGHGHWEVALEILDLSSRETRLRIDWVNPFQAWLLHEFQEFRTKIWSQVFWNEVLWRKRPCSETKRMAMYYDKHGVHMIVNIQYIHYMIRITDTNRHTYLYIYIIYTKIYKRCIYI